MRPWVSKAVKIFICGVTLGLGILLLLRGLETGTLPPGPTLSIYSE